MALAHRRTRVDLDSRQRVLKLTTVQVIPGRKQLADCFHVSGRFIGKFGLGSVVRQGRRWLIADVSSSMTRVSSVPTTPLAQTS